MATQTTITRDGRIVSTEPCQNSVSLCLVILDDKEKPWAMETPDGLTNGFSSLVELRKLMNFLYGVQDKRVRPSEQKPAWHITDRKLG